MDSNEDVSAMPATVPTKDTDRLRSVARWQFIGMLAPVVIALLFVFVIPLVSLLELSLHETTGFAVVGDEYTIANYVGFFTERFYIDVIARTLWLGLLVVFFCVLIGYPTSYLLARSRSRWRGALIFLVVSPLLVSAVVRNIGWFPILAREGLINTLLLNLGLIGEPLLLLNNMIAVVTGLVHALLPFMILTLTSVIQKIEPELEEAAANLGAGTFRILFQILLPLSMPGIIAGSLLVFTLSIAAFTTPAILGGNRVMVMATFIGQQFRTVLDYPLGAAAAGVLMLFVGFITIIAVRLGSRSSSAGVLR